ncbi:MAG: hypothetical protein BGO57_08880 [Sphingomonadales bacterium 63-6]|nr:MAG: hypothetical protein BGO57_08880 [Sphingomonadales bacterium 63-6]
MRWLASLAGRLGILCIGLFCLQAAYFAWTTGDPPPASLFGPRAVASVVEAKVISGRQNGSLRHTPLIRLAWPSEPTKLRGLQGSFYNYRLESAEAAIRNYRAGDRITVRVVDGLPYADRNDWFRLGSAVWMSLFAGAILGVGGAVAIADGARKLRRRISENASKAQD